MPSPLDLSIESLHRPIIIGIVGGIGSGKSSIGDIFVQAGAGRFDADRAGHRVLESDEVIELARERWGDSILKNTVPPAIDRRRLAQIVFESVKELDFLNHLTHSRIETAFREQLCLATREGKKLFVLDAPLLLETGWDSVCDRIIFVDANEEIRTTRTNARSWTKEEHLQRENNQISLGKKQKKSHYTIDNNSSYEKMVIQVQELINEISPPQPTR